MNRLYYGDNLDILPQYVANESVDLIYLDPPFNSNANYNVLFAEKSGAKSASQIRAFDDTWHWSEESEELYFKLLNYGGKLTDLIKSLRGFLGENDMMAYLVRMASTLRELRRVLKPNGSIYLHCDSTASHYLKLVLDSVFGPDLFQNEIIWKRTTLHSDSKTWSRITDTILFATKSDEFTWNTPTGEHDPEYIAENYKYKDSKGRLYRHDNIASPSPRPNMMYEWKGFPHPAMGWRFKPETMKRLDDEGRIWYPTKPDGSYDLTKRPKVLRFLDEVGKPVISNLWDDIQPLHPWMKEKLGYPTQKPEALLERILAASSNEGDVVMDPFCGCGTTVAVAQKLKRKWIGIDITNLAITLIRHRLFATYGPGVMEEFKVIGEPVSVPDAEALAKSDPYQFQWWALGLVGARPAEQKKGADKGIDGRLFFNDGEERQIVLSVKAGGVSVPFVRDLRGVIDREKATIGVLISFEKPTKPMIAEAASAGFYQSEWGLHPKIQLVTVEELLAGKKLDYPAHQQTLATFKKAPKFEAPVKEKPQKMNFD